MSRNDIDIKKRAGKVALIQISSSFLKVPQAMRAAGFSDGQSQNPTLQQRVRRIIKDNLEKENTMPTLGVVQIRPNPLPVNIDINKCAEKAATINVGASFLKVPLAMCAAVFTAKLQRCSRGSVASSRTN